METFRWWPFLGHVNQTLQSKSLSAGEEEEDGEEKDVTAASGLGKNKTFCPQTRNIGLSGHLSLAKFSFYSSWLFFALRVSPRSDSSISVTGIRGECLQRSLRALKITHIYLSSSWQCENIYLSMCLCVLSDPSIYLYSYPYTSLSIRLYVYLPTHPSIPAHVYLSIHL